MCFERVGFKAQGVRERPSGDIVRERVVQDGVRIEQDVKEGRIGLVPVNDEVAGCAAEP